MTDIPASPEVQIQDVIDELHDIHEEVQARLTTAPLNPTVIEAEEIARLTTLDEKLTTLFADLDRLDEDEGQAAADELFQAIIESEFPGRMERSG